MWKIVLILKTEIWKKWGYPNTKEEVQNSSSGDNIMSLI